MHRTSKSTFKRKREYLVFREEIKSLTEAGSKEGFPENRKSFFKVGVMVWDRFLDLE